MTRLSRHRVRANEVRVWLSVIAFNLGNLWRRLAFRADREVVANQLATAVGETGGRLIKHARYYLTRRLFGSMLRRIVMLPEPAG